MVSSLARQDVSPVVAQSDVRRYAYADPPYPGLARYYREHADYDGEVDHRELISRLVRTFDGWALSTSADALPAVLAMCPGDVSVAAWFRGPRPTFSESPLSSWEPVVYRGARRVSTAWSMRRLDSLVYVARPRLTDRQRVVGSKPAAFFAWLFTLLGLLPDDELEDVFPGSGRLLLSWQTYRLEQRRESVVQGSLQL